MIVDSITHSANLQIKKLYKGLFSGGKGLRSKMVGMVSEFVFLSEMQKKKLSQIVEYIHHSSILHDDVIDASPIRRGERSTWMQFSMKKSILAGDYLLAQAAVEISNLNNLSLMRLTSEVLKNLVIGEWMQDHFKGKETMDRVRLVHELKTASLFQWCLKAPFLIANYYDKSIHECLTQIGLIMGILFQRADDLLDFDIRNREKKMSFKDLREDHLNSFATFLSQNRSQKFKSYLKNCQSLKEVQDCVGGNSQLLKFLSQFDDLNRGLIADCNRQIEKLKIVLEKNQIKNSLNFIQQLKNWLNYLYWRKSV